jgi:carbon monoxide dehydrogenase subunit G
MTAWVTLESVSEQETLLRYRAQAVVGGKLASVGSRLVHAPQPQL